MLLNTAMRPLCPRPASLRAQLDPSEIHVDTAPASLGILHPVPHSQHQTPGAHAGAVREGGTTVPSDRALEFKP